MIKKCAYLLFLVLFLAFGCFMGPYIDRGTFISLIDSIFTLGSLLFAILGAWIAVLDPTSLFNKESRIDLTEKEELAKTLTGLLVAPSLSLVIALLTNMLIKTLPPLLKNIFPAFYYNYLTIMKITAGFIVAALYLTLIYTILVTLLPIVTIKNSIKKLDQKKNNRR